MRKEGQGILEYALLLGAIIAVLVVVLMSRGGISSNIHDSYIGMGNTLRSTVNNLSASF